MSHSTIQSERVQLSTVDDQDDESCDTEESPHSEVNLKRTCSSVISQPSVNLSIDLAASISGRLHPVHALNVAVVLEELSDRLAVLGKGLSAPMIDLRTDSSILFDQAHRPKVNLGGSTRISGGEWILRQRYDTVLPRRLQQLHRSVQTHRMNIGDSVKGNETLHHTDHGKAEISRAFAQDVIDRTLAEVVQERAFQTLINAVRNIQRKLLQDSNHVKSYWRNKQEIKRLKAELKKLSLDNVAETKRFKMALWTLQDSLQEHNIRCTLENKYTVQACEMRRSKSKKLCAAEENIVYEALVDMKKKYQFEYSVHAAMLDIINKMKSEAEAKLEYWLDKYEVDKESLTRSLDSLKAERAQCLERIAWIHEVTANYKPIVKDDRRVKKIEADRLARLELMTKRAIRIQAWWRGTMVRKGLGPFSRKNIKKDTQKKAGRKKKAKKK